MGSYIKKEQILCFLQVLACKLACNFFWGGGGWPKAAERILRFMGAMKEATVAHRSLLWSNVQNKPPITGNLVKIVFMADELQWSYN